MVPYVGAKEMSDVSHKGIYHQRIGSWQKSTMAAAAGLSPQRRTGHGLETGLQFCAGVPLLTVLTASLGEPGKGDLLSVAHV